MWKIFIFGAESRNVYADSPLKKGEEDAAKIWFTKVHDF